jgi:hypothetical protein
MEWHHLLSPPKKKFVVQTYVGKVMSGIFWDSEEFWLVEFLEIVATVNSNKYWRTLRKVKQRI